MKTRLLVFCLSLPLCATVAAQDKFKGIGRTATPAEIKAWDIDVRADFTGLPPGKGTVAKGQEIWDAKCASCHGVFGESNEVFPPLVGGTTAQDVKRGRAASLVTGTESQRTMLMKLSQVSTLWDYINRAMPWTAPKSLTIDEVYAVTAYILHLGEVVPADFTLSHENIRDVQAKLPNRNGLTREHGMWSAKGAGDVRAGACMSNCVDSAAIVSTIPDYARNQHGNLAQQMRALGGVRGVDTANPGAPALAAASTAAAVAELAAKNACIACHAANTKVVGPSWQQIAQKHKDRPEAVSYLAKKIREGGTGVWGAMAMPAQPQVSESDLLALAASILKAN